MYLEATRYDAITFVLSNKDCLNLAGLACKYIYRLGLFAAGLVDCAYLDQLVTQTWENLLCQYHMLSK